MQQEKNIAKLLGKELYNPLLNNIAWFARKNSESLILVLAAKTEIRIADFTQR